MKTLLLLRHAKSSWKDTSLADHDRPLNKRGKRDAPRMGELLRDEGLIPGLIVSSTAKRARRTAKRAAKGSGYSGEVQLSETLYHAGPEEFIQVLRDLPEKYESVMLVGHNPGLEEFLEGLTGAYRRLPTAALAQIHLEISGWSSFEPHSRGRLMNLWLPKEVWGKEETT